HLVLGGISQRLHWRLGFHVAVVLIQNGAYLRLLKNDFLYPDPIRRDALLPEQDMTDMTVVPVKHGSGEFLT
ncbi:hypothetical protein, partial [Pseudomonas syringae group genomosp. 7]|uniref:hypothetical protein n=1 Tax=Pseudomonas syringae group genomosp. 7 TaxID=251699 RepID=UPI00376F6C97